MMDKFIGREAVFSPKIIIVDEEGKYQMTTNRSRLPKIRKLKKAQLLGYELNGNELPITNPANHKEMLDSLFEEYDKIKK